MHSPTKRNRLHVSVFPPLSPSGDAAEWDDKMAIAFSPCFTGSEKGSDK